MQLPIRPLAFGIMYKGNIVIKDSPKWITFFVIKYVHMFGGFKWVCLECVPSLYISIVLATGSCLFSYISWSHLSPVTLKMYGLHGCAVGGQKQTLFTQWKKRQIVSTGNQPLLARFIQCKQETHHSGVWFSLNQGLLEAVPGSLPSSCVSV